METITFPRLQEDESKELETFRTVAMTVGQKAALLAGDIDTAEKAEQAAQWCAEQLGWCERIKTGFLGKMKALWHKGHSETSAQINELVNSVELAVGTVKNGIRSWRAIEARRVADEQAKALAEARKKHEEETLANAVKAEAAGHKPIADAILANAGNFVAPVIPVVKSKTHGGRMVWKVRIDPLKRGELLKMIADQPDLHSFVDIDEEKIRKQAVLMDGNLFQKDGKTRWPGVTCYQEEQLSIRKSGY